MRVRPITLLLVACVLVTGSARAALAEERLNEEMVAKIKEEGMARSKVMETISYLTDVYGPRLTGSPEILRASEWAKGRMSEWGLVNAQLEPWGPFGRGWSLEGFRANLLEPTYWPLIAYPKAWAPSTDGVVTGVPVYFDATKDEDLERYRGKLKGAIVLLSPPREVKAWFEAPGRRATDERLLGLANAELPPAGGGAGAASSRGFPVSPEQRAAFQLQSKKWQMIYDEGAAVVLEPGRGDGGTLFVQSATIPSPPGTASPGGFSRGPRPWASDAPPIVPQVVVAAEHYNRLVRMIQKGAAIKLELAIQARYHEADLMAYNVVAEIPGTDLKDEVVMLGAHFDAWHAGTGATDNASGSGVCMEAVRILQAVGAKPRRTVRIALWSGEEQGLFGSRAYVSEHFARRLEPSEGSASAGQRVSTGALPASRGPVKLELKPAHERFAAYFNLDNGTGKIRGIYLQGNDACRPIFRAWLRPFQDLGASTITISNTSGTDHLSFDAVGLPGFQFIQDPIEYDTRTHHSNMDVFERIQEEDMKQASVIMASFVYHAAMRDERLPRKPLPGEAVTQAAAGE